MAIKKAAREKSTTTMIITASDKRSDKKSSINAPVSLVRLHFSIVPKVFREETSPHKFAAFASFHETLPLAVSSAMLRLGAVTFMSTCAIASWVWIPFDRRSNFSHCHGFPPMFPPPRLKL